MSAVIPFPDRRIIRPNIAECVSAVEICEHDPALLLLCATAALNLVSRETREKGCVSERLAVKRLTIAFLALAELLGIADAKDALS